MNFAETLKSSLSNVFSNKLRTLLTILGIIIGISSVISITSIGGGIKNAMNAELAEFGTDSIYIYLSGDEIEQKDMMTLDDLALLKQNKNVKYAAPSFSGGNFEIKLLDPTKTNTANVSGVVSDSFYVDRPKLLSGRYIAQSDVNAKNNVVVIEDTTAKKVFGTTDCLGQKISLKTSIGTRKYTVIGITENKNAQMQSQIDFKYPDKIAMPISTLMQLNGNKYLYQIVIKAKDTNIMSQTASELVDLLEKAHNNADKHMYYAENMKEQLEIINTILSAITYFIAFVASMSLVVGGIGVMNIMLVTVTERTREIGIRKSLGARNFDIRRQFIIEAVVLTGIGGILGILLGWSIAAIADMIISNFFATFAPAFSASSIITAFTISSLIGIIFGVYPANKAALLDPIEALRYE